MDPYLAGFFESYLNIETAGYVASLKRTIAVSSPAWRERLKEIFEQLLTERSTTAGRFCDFTFIEFETDDDMYVYLTKVHAYLFLDAEEVPIPPD
ncbi:hypothetical protein ACIOJE_23850 [Kitasatospora sp. NPDC087861]|uniref:hypothetical protein n=1 Tax=Kitasatospora sp. NPDC087861 TaxID=3364070 RepID=UPI0037F6DC58